MYDYCLRICVVKDDLRSVCVIEGGCVWLKEVKRILYGQRCKLQLDRCICSLRCPICVFGQRYLEVCADVVKDITKLC